MAKSYFAALHQGAEPLVLFNVWDAGSARAVADAGAKAIATGSLSLAGAQGYDDGEELPFAKLLSSVQSIVDAVNVPVSIDIETGYAQELKTLKANAETIAGAGAVGCNLEDRFISGGGLRPVDQQCERIAAVDHAGLFVNARTDLFLGPLMKGENPNQADLVDEAIERAEAYRGAGAGCFFVPGLSDPVMIEKLCSSVDLPVNVMKMDGMASNAELGGLGVGRISYGPAPWRQVMEQLTAAATVALTTG